MTIEPTMTINQFKEKIEKEKAKRIKSLFKRFARDYVLDASWIAEDNYESFKKTEIFDILDAYDDLERETFLLRGTVEILKAIEKNLKAVGENLK